ncbi:Frag1/DRAM/Sfk1 family-domain-containing protein [Rhizoctonia solani]|nr:Frag1/DRAM/Sfk1 family-domain-containing protein [Rhizoctonia solani]
MYGFHAWQFPLAAAFMWTATLTAMIITWAAEGKPVYASQDGSIPYISDIGASFLKPLFVVGSVITGLGFFLTVLAERVYREKGRLLPNIRRRGRVMGIISCICALIAAAGLSLLAGFDTLRHTTLHRLFLLIFMLGTVLSAIATTVEFLVLRREARHAAGLMVQGLTGSYIAKLVIVVMEVGLSISFGITMYKSSNEVAAVLEWTIAYIFVFFLLSFYFDLRPAAGSPTGKYDVSGIVGTGSRAELGRAGRPSASLRGSEQETPEMSQVGSNMNRV